METTIKTKTGKVKKEKAFARMVIPGIGRNQDGAYFTLRSDDGQEYRQTIHLKFTEDEAARIVEHWGAKLQKNMVVDINKLIDKIDVTVNPLTKKAVIEIFAEALKNAEASV